MPNDAYKGLSAPYKKNNDADDVVDAIKQHVANLAKASTINSNPSYNDNTMPRSLQDSANQMAAVQAFNKSNNKLPNTQQDDDADELIAGQHDPDDQSNTAALEDAYNKSKTKAMVGN
jgi:hypothetical protein